MQYGLKKPVVIRYPRGGEGKIKFDIHENLEIGKAEKLKNGKDLSIIAIGKMVERAVEVSNILEKQDISVEVINARFLKPLDKEMMKDSISKTKNVITIEDNLIKGGLGSAIEELIVEERIECDRVSKYGYPDEFIKHGSVEEIENKYGLDAKAIAESSVLDISLKI